MYVISFRVKFQAHPSCWQVDATGTAWVAGRTESSLGGHENAGQSDIFLMAFSAEGTHLWTHQRGGAEWDEAKALQVRTERIFTVQAARWIIS